MNPTTASAPGKIILFGEHAVVYGQPAIAVPVMQLQATAHIAPAGRGAGFTIVAPDIRRRYKLASAQSNDPLAAIVSRVLGRLGVARAPDAVLTLTSTIPIASGLGSGAACSAAIARALAEFVAPGTRLDDDAISELVYQVERLHHGTPSGIDNTVIVYARPVYFQRGQPIQTFQPLTPFEIAIGDTGVSSPTRVSVGDVRAGWKAERQRYEQLFERIGMLVRDARTAIQAGAPDRLGPLMQANHELLREIGVSSPELERLVAAAVAAGAGGAKLSGGGRGGNMIALVDTASREHVVRALRDAGARAVLVTQIGA